MGALLQMINHGAAAPQVAQQVAVQHEPRVFNASFLERLAQLNSASRELRRMGLHVVWSRLAGPRPQAHIQRNANESLKCLLDRMGSLTFRKQDGCTLVSGVFEGVTVSWVEPA
jgi:hypothetical protein